MTATGVCCVSCSEKPNFISHWRRWLPYFAVNNHCLQSCGSGHDSKDDLQQPWFSCTVTLSFQTLSLVAAAERSYHYFQSCVVITWKRSPARARHNFFGEYSQVKWISEHKVSTLRISIDDVICDAGDGMADCSQLSISPLDTDLRIF